MPARKFIAEGPNLYGKYLRGPIHWAELMTSEDLEDIYSGGFLPYSGDPTDSRHLFYMCRSLRVNLSEFAMDKKRRYDHRIWKRFGLERVLMSKQAFIREFGPVMTDLAYKWMEPRFGNASLARDRFSYILSKSYLNSILTWRDKDELLAFALLAWGNWGAHYWYVFYKNETGISFPPGHGYLVDFLHWAKSENLSHAYLGTTYGSKSRYKSRGILGIEFWDGAEWCLKRELLTELRNKDDELDRVEVLSGP